MVCSISSWPQTVAFAHTSSLLSQPSHAFVIGSDPVDGSTIPTMPTVVRIFFNAPISPISFADVYTPDEQRVNASHSIVSSNNPRELDTPLLHPNQLPQGSYTVRWTAIASADGHTTNGVIGFNLGQSSSGLTGQTILGPSTSNSPLTLSLIGILAIAWEWLVLTALTFWIGTVIFEGIVIARVERLSALLVQTQKRVRPLQWLCLTALLVGECIALILRAAQFSQIASGGGIDLSALGYLLSQTTYGYLWSLRLLLIFCALAFQWWTTYRPQPPLNRAIATRSTSRFGQFRQRATRDVSPVKDGEVAEEQTTIPGVPGLYSLTWLLLAGLILLTYALTGDAAQLAQLHLSAVVMTWLNLVARCLWFGGLAYLVFVLLPLLPGSEPERYAETLIVLLQRCIPFILGSIGVFLITGLYLTETNIGSFQLFITDPFGRTALVASILIVFMLLLNGYALWQLRPKLVQQTALLPVVNIELPARRSRQTALDSTTRSLRQTLLVHSWLAAAALFCAALMAFFAPPIVFPNIHYTQNGGPTSPANNTPNLLIQTQQVGILSVTLQVLPGRVGYPNTVIVTMNDAHGTLVTNARVQLHTRMELMDMGIAQATISGGNPTYIATFAKDAAFSMAGRWDIALSIYQSGQSPLQTTFTINLTNI